MNDNERRPQRDDLVQRLVDQYREHGPEATVALFDKFIRRYDISQIAIRSIILEFRTITGDR